jgi:hypothetical protein
MTKSLFALLICIALSVCGSNGLAETVVVDFDDLDGPFAPIPAGYAGFTSWGSFASSSAEDPPAYYPHSGTTYAISVGLAAPIVFGTSYAFEGAWFVGYSGNGVAFELYFFGALVHTSEILETGFDYQWLDSGYDGMVDQVKVIYAMGINFWAMDDFTYDNGIVANESSSWSELKCIYR